MTEGDRVLAAIEVIQDHIRKDYIVEGCREERVAGCVSCAMVRPVSYTHLTLPTKA